MKDFNWTQFSKRIFIKADLQTVYDAWTKSSHLERWFLSMAEFYSVNNEKIPSTQNVESNSKYEWKWFAQNHLEKGIITQTNGRDFIEFTFAGNCKVQIHLSKENNQTLVELLQNDIPLDDLSKENIRLGCAFGWSFYMLNLKSVLEGGIDLRNKDTELVGVINN